MKCHSFFFFWVSLLKIQPVSSSLPAALGCRCCTPAFCGSGLHGLRGCSSPWHLGFSLWRLPLLWSACFRLCALQESGRTGFLALRHVGSSQTRGKTYVPSTAPAGKSLDSIFLKELNLVSEGSTEVANGAMVVGESFKSCAKGSPRMAGKSTRGKRDKQKKKPDPELGLLGRGWGSAGPLETLFSLTSAAAHRHL